MESQTLRTRYGELSRALAEIEVSSDMAPHIRAAVAGQLDILAADAERNLVPDTRSCTDPEARDDGARFFRQLAMTNSWLDGRDDVTRRWIDRAAELASTDVLKDMLRSEQNSLRDSETFAGISALCQAGRVDKARRVLVARRKASNDPVTRKRIDEVLADPRNLLGPLASAPALSTVNGVGSMLHGERNRGSDGTYVATLCFVVLFMPLLPIRAYLVRSEGANGWRFFGVVPLSPFAFWYRRIAILIPFLVAFYFWGVNAWESSPTITENRALAAAEQKLARKDFSGTLQALAPVAPTTDASRSARLAALMNQALTGALKAIQGPHDGGKFLATTGSWAARLRRPLMPETEAAAETAFTQVAHGRTARDFIVWYGVVFPNKAARRADLTAKACESSTDPMVLALAADLFVEAKRPCPPEILARLKGQLVRVRHETWAADTLSYLRAADPADAAPVLLARVESVWTGHSGEPDLLDLKSLPEPLRKLIGLDGEADPEKRVAGLEKAADPAGLEEPQKSWHRLGVARRLIKAYGQLNEKDPLKHPVSKVRPWAIEAAQLAPEDVDTRVTALRYLLEDGEFDRVVSIGGAAPKEARTASLVGIALARAGKTEQAAALLRPIVERDLPEFTTSLQTWEKAYEEKTARVWKTLETGTAPKWVFTRLNSLPKEKAGAEAEKYVREQVERDDYIKTLGLKWRQRLEVHPAASELAMVELTLGRTLPPGAERQARLEAAEHLFLELRKTAQDDPHQELQLGQVYFWLGKNKEGAEIFDRLEAGGDPKVLHQLGSTYRTLSRMDAARRVLEAAYGKAATPKEKNSIALTRSISTDDLHDRLAWLQKCEPKSEHLRMEIDQTEAYIDVMAGKYDEGARALKRVAEYYANLPESSTTLNNGAIARLELAKATGDMAHVVESVRLMRRSHELAPEDGIVLGNYVSDLQRIGIAALAGTALRADLLHEMPDKAWLDFVVPRPSPQEWAAKAKAQPELRRSAELAPKAAILSPDAPVGYFAQAYYFSLTEDAAALRKLRESVELRPPAREEAAADAKRYARGEWTESELKMTEHALAASNAQIERLRKATHPATLAYGLLHRAGLQTRSRNRGIGSATLDAAVRDVEEALKAFDAPVTRQSLAWIRMEQAATDVAAADEVFARWVKETPSLSAGTLLPLYAQKRPEAVASLRGRESVRKAAAACADAVAAGGRTPSLTCWAWLEMAGHDSREQALNAIRSHPTFLESQRLDYILDPLSTGDVLTAWQAATACGEKALAEAIAGRAKTDGVFPLFFK